VAVRSSRPPCGKCRASALRAGSALEAEAALLAPAKELDRTHPEAASLREGLDETLTLLRLNVPPTLARTLRSTTCIESMISVCRDHASNIKRWRAGQMALRWCAAAMVEAGTRFRRVNGHLHLTTLRTALQREIPEPVGPVVHTDEVSAA
jgi:putative transposase